MGAWLVWEARNLGMSKWQLTRMLGNVGIDVAVGAVPVVGDLIDFAFRSNSKNLRIVPSLPQARDAAPPPPDGQPVLSPYQFAKKVERAMEQYVRPMLRKDGGDVEIIDIKETLVYCQLRGACAGCCSAGVTLKMMVEQKLKDLVDERIRVIQV